MADGGCAAFSSTCALWIRSSGIQKGWWWTLLAKRNTQRKGIQTIHTCFTHITHSKSRNKALKLHCAVCTAQHRTGTTTRRYPNDQYVVWICSCLMAVIYFSKWCFSSTTSQFSSLLRNLNEGYVLLHGSISLLSQLYPKELFHLRTSKWGDLVNTLNFFLSSNPSILSCRIRKWFIEDNWSGHMKLHPWENWQVMTEAIEFFGFMKFLTVSCRLY